MARKHAFEYPTFVRRELRRARRRRPPLQRVIPAAEPGQELGFFVLLDLHVPAHRQIHERRGDVAQVGRVVDQRPGFRGRQPCWRLVLHGDRTPRRVPPPFSPSRERQEKYRDWDRERPIAPNDPGGLLERARLGDHALVPSHDRGEALVEAQCVRHRNPHRGPARGPAASRGHAGHHRKRDRT